MAEVRFYLDENVATGVATGLRLRGIDVATVVDMGTRGADDAAHLAVALANGRVIFTYDSDFLKLAAAGTAHGGVIYASRQMPIGNVIRALSNIHALFEAGDVAGTIRFL